MRSICQRPGNGWLYAAIAFLALIGIGACSSDSATTCRTPTLTGTEVVALRLSGEDTAEIVISSNEGTRVLESFDVSIRPKWYAFGLADNNVAYVWIGNSDRYPAWLKAPSRERIEPAECKLGDKEASLVVTYGDVMLIQDGRATILEALPVGATAVSVSIFG